MKTNEKLIYSINKYCNFKILKQNCMVQYSLQNYKNKY